jgi:hypothetical protein
MTDLRRFYFRQIESKKGVSDEVYSFEPMRGIPPLHPHRTSQDFYR